ncbi:MAG: factor-independent urate hydroxylase [Verrucomicrobiota bacterium]
MKLIQHRYGKARVRVLKVTRRGIRHSIKELEVAVALQGDFKASYTRSDNRLVVATDSMKNIVNVLAQKALGTENESFGCILGEHFLTTYPHVNRVEVALREHCWDRVYAGGKPHAHSFREKSAATPLAKIVSTRKGTEIESGIENLLILKSTGSGFATFLRDKFTTLPETNDRILATRLKATWHYQKQPRSFSVANEKILNAMLATFANNFSPSVQTTLFQMGESALKAVREISRIHLEMPNQHCLPINLAPFGLKYKNDLFVPTDEPHGQIEGTIIR